MVIGKINTKDLLQIRGHHNAVSSNICVTCYNIREIQSHLFLHCLVAWDIWSRVLAVRGEFWIVPRSMEDMSFVIFVSFGRGKDYKFLWPCVGYGMYGWKGIPEFLWTNPP